MTYTYFSKANRKVYLIYSKDIYIYFDKEHYCYCINSITTNKLLSKIPKTKSSNIYQIVKDIENGLLII